ncbi:MAG: VCBS repeat-containing protein, partial [Flavobacteriales bacterium]|nr:VCBS repeat-containing protein [Flavobacteriales bacterium]
MTAARLTGCSLVLASGLAAGQFALTYDPSPPLSRDGSSLPLAWAGGLNFVQVSDIDLDGDGDKDLFVFDRSGDEAVFLLNNGTSGTDGYTITHAYDHVYPFSTLENWALMRDYDADGREDLFAAVNAGFAVYRNVSGDGVLAFELIDDLVGSDYDPVYSPNINTYGTDVPGFADIDGDGDLDLLTFGIGNQLDYHSNQSVELYGHTDSLIYRVRNRCWGYFAESGSSSTIQLDYICAYNVEDPELPVIGHGETTALDRADVGSTMLPIDLDGDGDKDLLIGDVQSPNIIALTNGGDQDSAYMVAQDPHFPAYDEPIELDRFVGTFYVDVDNDGVRDLLASPSFGGQSENLRSLWYYQNIGPDDVPVFSKRSENLFQRDMFDVGEGAWPVLFDFDGDSLMDLIVANYGYYSPDIVFPARLIALRNTGTATAPAFTVVSEDYASLGSSGLGNAMYPAFGDLDGDGDKDLYVGDRQGR